jgi:hypothetical protein
MAILLSPYEHELHWSGNRCAKDCPACRWVREWEVAVVTSVLGVELVEA